MHPLRFFLGSVLVQLWLWPCLARQAHLRQMHVVSVGEGNVECDDHSPGCEEALRARETDGVLLLPESQHRWHAFNVQTLLLPQHDVSVSQQVDQNSLLAQSSTATLVMLLQKSSMTSTVLLLGVFICLGLVLFNMFGDDKEPPYAEKEREQHSPRAKVPLPVHPIKGEAIDLLNAAGCIKPIDWANRKYMDECVEIAIQMLKEEPHQVWVADKYRAQNDFKLRLAAHHRAKVEAKLSHYKYDDGDWTVAYQRAVGSRREAFELLVFLKIVSEEDFANTLHSQSYIDSHIEIATSLLNQKPSRGQPPLNPWVQGDKFKESVVAMFKQGGGFQQPEDEWEVVPPRVATPPPARSVPEIRNMPDYSRPEVECDPLIIPGSSTFTSTSYQGARYHSQREVNAVPDQPGQFTSTPPQPTVSPRRSDSVTPPQGTSPRSPRTLLVLPKKAPGSDARSALGASTMPVTTPALRHTAAEERPRTLQWPQSEGSLGTRSAPVGSDRALRSGPPGTGGSGSTSQGWPVQIRFANNAISGSSWEASASGSITPPSANRDL